MLYSMCSDCLRHAILKVGSFRLLDFKFAEPSHLTLVFLWLKPMRNEVFEAPDMLGSRILVRLPLDEEVYI